MEKKEGKGTVRILLTRRGDFLPVSGASYGTFRDGVLAAVSEEVSQGKYVIRDVPAGEYRLWELKMPDGYIPDMTEYPVTVSDDGILHIEAVPVRGKVRVEKRDADHLEDLLSGAEFTVYAGEKKVCVLEEKEKGIYEAEGLLYGRYTIRETKAPYGFRADPDPYEFRIIRNGETVKVENTLGMGFLNEPERGFLFLRLSSEDGAVAGVPFLLEGMDILGRISERKIVTDGNGEKCLGLRPGVYFISEEEDASGRYRLPEKQTVTLTADDAAECLFRRKLRKSVQKAKVTAVLFAAFPAAGFPALSAGKKRRIS